MSETKILSHLYKILIFLKKRALGYALLFFCISFIVSLTYLLINYYDYNVLPAVHSSRVPVYWNFYVSFVLTFMHYPYVCIGSIVVIVFTRKVLSRGLLTNVMLKSIAYVLCGLPVILFISYWFKNLFYYNLYGVLNRYHIPFLLGYFLLGILEKYFCRLEEKTEF